MTKAIWIIFIVFALGDAFFIPAAHWGNQKISSNYTVNDKKDSILIKTVFPDSPICLKLNMLPEYDALYPFDSTPCASGNPLPLLVNINITHDVGFLSVLLPFYKSDNFNAEISYKSILKIVDQPERDSLALNSTVSVKGNITLLGFFSPIYARKLVQKELVMITKKEMDKLRWDVNKPEAVAIDTIPVVKEIPKAFRRPSRKKK